MFPSTRALYLLCGLSASLACRDFEADAAPSAAGQPSTSAGADSGQTSAGGRGGAAGVGGGAASSQAGALPMAGAGASLSGNAGHQDVEPIEPDALDGLALWLTASQEWCVETEDHEVVSWADRSGHHNDAKALASQQRPKFLEVTLTGHSTLKFARAASNALPSNLVVPDHDSLRFGEGDFAYVVVARLRNDAEPAYDDGGQLVYAGSGLILAKLEKSYPYKGIAMFANYPALEREKPAYRRFAVQLALSEVLTFSHKDNVNDDTFRVYTARRKAGNDIEIRINGVVENRSMISGALDVSASRSDLVIGGWANQPFEGDISEIVVVRGSVDDRSLLALEKGLLQKYRL